MDGRPLPPGASPSVPVDRSAEQSGCCTNSALANDKGRLQVAVRDAEAAGMSHEANIGRRKLATLL